MKHIFYVGPRGVGKSTLVRQAFQEVGICPAGFLTRKIGSRIVMQPPEMGWAGLVPGDEQTIASCGSAPGSARPIPGAMVRLAGALLATPGQGPVVMDELGYLESEDAAFCALVHKTLDERLCVGVLRQADAPFLARIGARPDVTIYTVTVEGRDRLRAELALWLRKRF